MTHVVKCFESASVYTHFDGTLCLIFRTNRAIVFSLLKFIVKWKHLVYRLRALIRNNWNLDL